jgi:hypothetical protein
MLPDRATKGERSMSEKRYLATLTTEEEKQLRDIMNRGKHGAGNTDGRRRYCAPMKAVPI